MAANGNFSVVVVRCFLLCRSRRATVPTLPALLQGQIYGAAGRELILAPARPSRVSDLAAATAADHLLQSCGQADERSSPDPGDSPACPRDPGQVTVSGGTIFRGVRPRRCRSGRCSGMTFR